MTDACPSGANCGEHNKALIATGTDSDNVNEI